MKLVGRIPPQWPQPPFPILHPGSPLLLDFRLLCKLVLVFKVTHCWSTSKLVLGHLIALFPISSTHRASLNAHMLIM